MAGLVTRRVVGLDSNFNLRIARLGCVSVSADSSTAALISVKIKQMMEQFSLDPAQVHAVVTDECIASHFPGSK